MRIEFTETPGDAGSFMLIVRWGSAEEKRAALLGAAVLLGLSPPREFLERMKREFDHLRSASAPAPEAPAEINRLAALGRRLLPVLQMGGHSEATASLTMGEIRREYADWLEDERPPL